MPTTCASRTRSTRCRASRQYSASSCTCSWHSTNRTSWTWDFIFRFKRFGRELQTIRGGSHVELDAQGRITLHRDYWDAAEELYEKLPLVGGLMRWLKRRANG
jgi:hypothetical protein